MLNYEMFLEAKSVGVLYHFTNFIGLYHILRSNSLTSSREVDTFPELVKSYGLNDKLHDVYISFTRNKLFYKTHHKNMDVYMNVRITIDGDKLSNKYKIYKVNYFSSGHPTEKESEECVVVPYELKNLNDYILKIEIPTFEEFRNEIEYGIKRTDMYEELLTNMLQLFNIVDSHFDMQEMGQQEKEQAYKKLYDDILMNIEYDDYLHK